MSRKNYKKKKSTVPQSLVDIIIPVHNRFDLVEQCLDALPEAADGIDYKVIIIDNDSNKIEADDFYSKILDRNYKIIRNKENRGFPATCNQGASRGTSPLLFFLNDDCIMQPRSLKQLVSDMDDPKIGVVGMKLLFPNKSDLDQRIRPPGKVQHVGLHLSIRGIFMHSYVGWSADHPKVNAVREVQAVTGAALMTRRRLFVQAGRFFDGYGAGTYEDVDYCYTLREMGYDIIVDTKAVAYHYTNATGTTFGIQYPMQQNHVTFMGRWGQKLEWKEWRYW